MNISESNYTETFDSNEKFVHIHIRKDLSVYVGEKQVFYFDEITSLFNSAVRKWSTKDYINSTCLIICDPEIDYVFVDRLKSEIARLGKYWIGYKNSNGKDSDIVTGPLDGTIHPRLISKPIPRNLDFLNYGVDVELEASLSSRSEDYNFFEKSREIKKMMYAQQFDKLRIALKDFNLLNVKVLPNSKYLFKGKNYTLEGLITQLKRINHNQILLAVFFDSKLTLNDYLVTYLESLHKGLIKLKFENDLNRFDFFEVSKELELIMDNKKVVFQNSP